MPHHVPVLVAEVLDLLAPQPGQVIVDATIGAGGHARLLAERLRPGGQLIGLDRDEMMLALAQSELAASRCPVKLVHSNFDRLTELLNQLGITAVDSVLADLGICSDQLDDPQRGFTFQEPGPLDMRMDTTTGEPAANLLRRLSERDLADMFWKYGEERWSRRVARRIVERRRREPLETTEQLAQLIRGCVPRPRGRQIDPATRVFQALRIAVNDELGALERFLEALPASLKPGGRAVIISFHSLEDRRVKRAFRDRQHWEILTKKPVEANEEELRQNPRARSAKLRAGRRCEAAQRREAAGG
jgi:16S rRNA (cytosine1402-N4)-methyltransferase